MTGLRDYSPARKALEINLDDSIYGTFAEIGAGQEVARHFFQVGRASHTIAKTISAYDMTFSDEIYGKENRYVCESRVLKMLDHEFSLLQERLHAKRGASTRFFAFADTVATHTGEESTRSHGWMGVRFQMEPGGSFNDVVIHVRLWDRFRLQQQEALGLLGVNLLHMAFFPPENDEDRVRVLIDNLNVMRVEVNAIRFHGPDINHLNNRIMNLALVRQGLTEAVLFGPQGDVLHVGDTLFKKPVLVQRGTYRPITKSNEEILRRVLTQFKSRPELAGLESPKVLLEVTTKSLTQGEGSVDQEDFLHRVDTLSSLGHEVLVSNFQLFYQLKFFLRQYTREPIAMVVGASLLPKLFDPQFYKSLPGGLLEGMSRLFDEKTQLYVFPSKESKSCATANTFHSSDQVKHLFQHLLSNGFVRDVLDCDDLETEVHSHEVRALLQARDPKWQKLVPESVRQLIIERQLFGYRP
jgi:hypothetical protein